MNWHTLRMLKLFERSLEQYENYKDLTLSMMLLFSVAESLLTERDNEKNSGYPVIWPRLVTIIDKDQKDLCILIRDPMRREIILFMPEILCMIVKKKIFVSCIKC